MKFWESLKKFFASDTDKPGRYGDTVRRCPKGPAPPLPPPPPRPPSRNPQVNLNITIDVNPKEKL